MDNLIIAKNTAHLWRVHLPDLLVDARSLSCLLSEDEMLRAERFHFDIHRDRFIVSRALLRRILSLYTRVAANEIVFQYGPHKKPFLLNNPMELQFNVSHSHDMAVVALTYRNVIGVDIEKIEPSFKDEVAKRFFSGGEYEALTQLSDAERVNAFYRLWAGKEAVIKALGAGLYVPLDSFVLDLCRDKQVVQVGFEQRLRELYLVYVSVAEGYQSAVVVGDVVGEVREWEWGKGGPVQVG